MNNQILSCCDNKPSFRIEYHTGDSFLVCSKCYEKPFWNRHVSKKRDLLISKLSLSPKNIEVHNHETTY